jgi:hypothetical protein
MGKPSLGEIQPHTFGHNGRKQASETAFRRRADASVPRGTKLIKQQRTKVPPEAFLCRPDEIGYPSRLFVTIVDCDAILLELAMIAFYAVETCGLRAAGQVPMLFRQVFEVIAK